MLPFSDLDLKVDVRILKTFLECYEGWGENPQRGLPGSPHEEMTDIWVRFNDPEPCKESGDWSSFIEEHESIWLKRFTSVDRICKQLMKLTEGERLGGVLITKLPPCGKIHPHIDSGWHAEYYDKYYVPIKNGKGARFCFDDGFIEPEEGQVFAFRNDVTHWVENNSEQDRIAMIICIKQSKYSKEGLCLGQQRRQ